MMRLPGDVAVVGNGGKGGDAIRLADRVKAKRLGLTAEPYNHAAIAIDDEYIVQADARKGAILSRASELNWRIVSWRRWIGLSLGQQDQVATVARFVVGTSYNYLDIVALALDAFGLANPWVIAREASNKTLVCSQLVDYCYFTADLHLFDDGRNPGAVTPGDLARCPLLVEVTE